MLETAQKYYKQYVPRLQDLQDIRVVGMVIFAIVVLWVSWSGIRTIDENYQLQKQISVLEQQNGLQGLRNQNLKLQNNYYNTDQYLELAARQNFGLAKPGETELIIPKSVALAHSISAQKPKQTKAASAQPAWQRNLQAWVDFFLHRQTDH